MYNLCSTPIIKYNDRVLLVHGTESDPLWGKQGKVTSASIVTVSPVSNVVLQGHSHIQGYYKTGNTTYINPGSVGQPRNGDNKAQYLVANNSMTSFIFNRVSYDIDSAASKIMESGRPSFLATRLYLGI